MQTTWLDRTIGYVAPQWHLQRVRSRVVAQMMQRKYEGAADGRRTSGWMRSNADANAAAAPYIAKLRATARDLVENNPYAAAAIATIADHTVGWGIVAKAEPASQRAQAAWDRWANTTACDAAGRCNFAGLQKLVMRAVAQDGEVLIRRRPRLPEDNLPLPFQLEVLEADYLDTMKTDLALPNGGWIINGVEFSPFRKRVAYWMFEEHPGSVGITMTRSAMSVRIPADGVLHVFLQNRPEAERGVTWFAPVMVKIKDFDEYEDATLMKQKIAACLAVITSDVDGSAAGLGTTDDASNPPIDSLEPGMVMNVPPGRSVDVVQPPSVTDYEAFCNVNLRAIATGLGVTYEDMTGSYAGLPFSAARMSRLRHWAHVDDWRWRMLIPQFCDPVWGWAMQSAAVMGMASSGNLPTATWTPPPMPMLEPDKEGLAIMRNIRTGIQTLSGALREQGYDPETQLAEMKADAEKLDELGLKLDCDGRYMTQAGQLQGAAGKLSIPSGAGKNG